MTITKENGVKSAEKVIQDFIRHDDVKHIRETLTELFHEWVQSEIDRTQEERKLVLYHYQAIQNFLSDAKELQKERRAS